MKAQDDIELDDAVVEQIATLICGDDPPLRYRQGWEIVKFFRAAGWDVPDDLDGDGRRSWVLAQFGRRKPVGNRFGPLVLRLADPREYIREESARSYVLDELNAVLALEGLQVVMRGSRPSLEELDELDDGAFARAPLELTARLSEIVNDREFGEQLSGRLNEAYRCWQADSPTAAIILLGSILEGVLYDVARHRDTTGKQLADNLARLIDLARDSKWISQATVDHAHVLRDHRNLVHPKKQWTQSYTLDEGAVLISWNVVVATLNALEKLPPVGDVAH